MYKPRRIRRSTVSSCATFASMNSGWISWARRRFRCSTKKAGVASVTISRYASYILGSAIEVPAMSSWVMISVIFICTVLIVIVTWSGLGVSSASIWRVS